MYFINEIETLATKYMNNRLGALTTEEQVIAVYCTKALMIAVYCIRAPAIAA